MQAPLISETHSWYVRDISAGLTASMNNFGIKTTGIFKIGVHADLSNASVFEQHVDGISTSGVAFHKVISDLAPNTTYYYQALASNANGTAASDIKSFRTVSVLPPVRFPEVPKATNIQDTSCRFETLINLEGFVVSIFFQYGKKADLSDASIKLVNRDIYIEKPTFCSAVLEDLEPETTYYFRFTGSNGTIHSQTAILSFTTLAKMPAQAPVFIETHSWNITNVSGGLSGSVNNFGITTKGTFKLSKKSDLSDAVSYDHNIPGYKDSGVSFHQKLNGLSPATTYYYQTTVVNDAGKASSAIMNFTTLD